MFMVMFVLDDICLLNPLLESWVKIGITGATILESSGLHRSIKKTIPMRYAYVNQAVEENGNISIFTIVANEEMVEHCLKAIESIVGDLDQPNTGVFAAWPLLKTKGIAK